MTDVFLAAKYLADELEAQWQQSFARFSCGMMTKDAPDPKGHFEIRVRGGTIAIVCRTAQANGWHRIRRRNGKPWKGVPVESVFEPLKLKDGNYHVPEAVEHPCETCGEPTFNKKLCRDCALDELIDGSRCPECTQFVYNDWAAKTFNIERAGHSAVCSKTGGAS